MNDHSRRFIDHNDGGIFIENGKGKRFWFERKGDGLGEEPRDQVACFHMSAGFSEFLIEGDEIFFDQVLCLGTGEVEVDC